MIAKALEMSAPQRGILAALKHELHGWLLTLGLCQDGPAGRLPEDMAGRRGQV